MLSSFKATVLILSILGVASASPLVPRVPKPPGICRPNFQGANLVVTNRGDATHQPTPPVNFQFTGQPTNTYVIRPIGLVDQVIAATGTSPGSTITTVDINFNSADPLQLWNVLCETCGDPSPSSNPFTSGCSVSLAANDLCVQLDFTLQPCTGGDDQKWDFSTA